jgi:hypothetical protein
VRHSSPSRVPINRVDAETNAQRCVRPDRCAATGADCRASEQPTVRFDFCLDAAEWCWQGLLNACRLIL